MEPDSNPFENITVVQFVGQYHVPRETTLQQLYNRGWWISFVCSRDVCLIKKRGKLSFTCKFLKLHRGVMDEKTIKKIEKFNEKQWNKYKHIMLGENYETNNQI